MKIYLGNYKTWIGPFQIASILKHVGVKEEIYHDVIGEWLSKTWVNDVCEYIYSKRDRTIKIKLHDYDTWNLDSTLALIIAPCLKQLKETTHGSASGIDQADVPENLRCPPEKLDPALYGVPSEYLHPQWEWLLDEMIWAFNSITTMDDMDMTKEQQERQTHGLKMFGKYYTALWD